VHEGDAWRRVIGREGPRNIKNVTLSEYMNVSNKFSNLMRDSGEENEPNTIANETKPTFSVPCTDCFCIGNSFNFNSDRNNATKPQKLTDSRKKQGTPAQIDATLRSKDPVNTPCKPRQVTEPVNTPMSGSWEPLKDKSARECDEVKAFNSGAKTTTRPNDQETIAIVEFAQEDGAVLVAEEQVQVEVTMDSGSVVNVMHPEDLPSGCQVQKTNKTKNFVGANGGVIANHGVADTQMSPVEQGNGAEVRCRWDCADVTRPLLSTGVTCDSGYEVLHTSDEAVVVPKGSLSRFLKGDVNVVQRFQRKNKGLYITTMNMRAPKASDFTRPSTTPK